MSKLAEVTLMLNPGKLERETKSVELIRSMRGCMGLRLKVAFMELLVGYLKKVFSSRLKVPL